VREYLAFRLRAAGYHGPDLFSTRVIRYLARATGGLTRRINIVADKALLAAFAESTHNVSLRHAQAAVRDSEFTAAGRRSVSLRQPGWAGAVGLAILALAAGAVLHRVLAPSPQAPPPAPAAIPSGGLQPRRAEIEPPAQPASAGPVPAPADNAEQVRAVDGGGSAASDATRQPDVRAAPPSDTVRAEQPLDDAIDLLEQRLLAADRWLAQEQGGAFSIQLLGSPDPALLRSYLRTLSKYIDKDSIFVYRTVANQGPSMTVLYGTFATRAEALSSLDRLPAELKVNRPYIRTVQGIRTELGKAKPS
jgi:hypothetical protein